ncbi:type II secretion system protein [Armatimonas rosea]|uniref:Prepilin-type N-terminal cleavage/methylation domain-containing protein/prepilin-type processing-associated H-X9-DG protein n=1 Tax=Armatimonas rosea TaxID=685828 RepID=A0A7W9W693_ARMRO|nr:DUF1559 domain-containing protein [Armatimonas rosea]MBB6049337.1 prepilin-type N-terminal cleavage/methylation domain-containing protein/prepilin-type processing-associated H-X9-DG protein [Armatimonas rosea]
MRRGFTLTELLVVIAIIAILAAILFPVFAQVRGKARQSVCLTNMKQLALAQLMYSQDYDETPPAVFFGEADTPRGYTWRFALHPYVRSHEVHFCPQVRLRSWRPDTRRRAFRVRVGTDSEGQPLYDFVFSTLDFRGTAAYAVPRVHRYPGGATPLFANLEEDGVSTSSLAAVAAPAQTVLLVEAHSLFSGSYQWDPRPSDSHGQRLGATRHTNGSNSAFADGHARWSARGQLGCGTGGGADRCPWSIE